MDLHDLGRSAPPLARLAHSGAHPLPSPVQPNDIIAAIGTAGGRSSRAMVRVSGARAFEAIGGLFDRIEPSRGARQGTLRLGDALELPVLMLVYPGPGSYTGEDSLEVLIPGNPVLAERVLESLVSLEGVRRAEPGEFSARAYLNGRLSVEEAEGVALSIAAETDEELAGARSLLDGSAGQQYRAWAEELTTLLALVEAGIDFTDQEDVVAIEPIELADRVGRLREEIDATLGAASGAERRAEHPLVALYGAPNAGKSTLFNALLARPRAVESPQRGTTRDVLVEELDLSAQAPGLTVLLADGAGREAGADEIGAGAQDALDDLLARSDVVVWCDPSGAFAGRAPSERAQVIRVRTKADLPEKPTGRTGHIAICALDGWRLDELSRAIAEAAWGSSAGGRSLLPRHRAALAACRSALPEASSPMEPELIAGALRVSLDALGALTGRVDPDEVIGRIFASFCVGK